jgi:hypothetical protein
MVDGFKKFLPWGRRHVLALFLCATVLGPPAARAQQAPTFTSIQRDGQISWTSQYAVSYQLQKTTRLDSTNWTNVGSPVAGNGRTLTATDPSRVTAQAFYRLVASNAFSCGNSGGTACSNATFLGNLQMDTRSGLFCTTTPCRIGPTVTGCGNGWFRLTVREESGNCSGLRADIALDSPPGLDYDLYIYEACGWQVGSSTSGAGLRDSVTYQPIDFPESDNSANLWIEVRFFSGSGPGLWTLRMSGGAGPCY